MAPSLSKGIRMNDDRKLFLVGGSESSGTRWLTSGLIAAGCCGDPGHDQAFDNAIGNHGNPWPTHWPAVARRSYPHGDGWPDLSGIQQRIRDRFDAETIVVAIHRNFSDTIRSKVRNGNCSAPEAEAETRFAFEELARQLGSFGGTVVEVRYERLRHESERRRLFDALGLPLPASFAFRG